ncbi:MAG: hypothetical protein CL565_00050 [Alphaproteobacteria bacterium]|nr:hypothetical protein [Alphaproteobacteria bacterium]
MNEYDNEPVKAQERPPNNENHSRSSWKANIQLIFVLGFLIVAFILSQTIGTGEREEAQSTKTQPILVRTVDVTPSTQAIRFTRTGETEVNNEIRIVPQVSGRIVNVHPDFDDGGVFEADAELFKIEQDDYINQRDIARAEVERAQTQLALEQAEAQASREEWESLNPSEPIPSLVARAPQLDQAKANLRAARAQLEDAKLGLERTVFSLPYAGRVIETDIDVGQYVQAGQNYGLLYSRDAVQIRVPLEDRLLQYLNEDETNATINTVYRGENVSLNGEIERIGGQLNENTRFVDVIITPTGQNWDKILPNVFAEVELTGQEIDSLWELPNSVMQGAQNVWIVKDDDTLELYSPQILSIGDEYTLAIGSGEKVTLVDGLLKGGGEGMKIRRVEDAENEVVEIDNANNENIDSEIDAPDEQRLIEPMPTREPDDADE